VGIAASSIVDTPTLPIQIDDQAFKVDGVFGSIMVKGSIAIFLDVDRLLAMWDGVREKPRLTEGARRRILVVEDESIVARDLALTLNDLGYEVVGFAGTGEAALLEARTNNPDLVLMDICLTGAIDGIEAAHAIKRELNLPIVFLTADRIVAHIGQDLAGRRQGFGINPFVRVPEVGADDGAGALEVDLLHRHDDDRAGRLAVHPERRAQLRIGGNLRAAVDA
jgi:CheY-like chemotaxis protein